MRYREFIDEHGILIVDTTDGTATYLPNDPLETVRVNLTLKGDTDTDE